MLFYLTLLILSIINGVFGQLMLKHGMSGYDAFGLGTIPKVARNPWVVGGFTCYGLNTFTWLFLLTKLDLSFMYPMISLGYVMVLFFSRIAFGEQIPLVRWAGVVLICGGVCMVGFSG